MIKGIVQTQKDSYDYLLYLSTATMVAYKKQTNKLHWMTLENRKQVNLG